MHDPGHPEAAPHPRKPLLQKAAEAFMAITLALMIVAVFSNVVLRYAFGTGLVVYEELSRLLFVWLVCTGTTVTAYERKHLSFTLVVERIGPRLQRILYALAGTISVIVLGMVIKGAWDQVIAGLYSHSPVMGYPLALTAAATLLMAAIMAILIVVDAIAWRPRRPEKG